MSRHYLEFVLSVKDASAGVIRNSLVEFGEGLEIVALNEEAPDCRDFRIRIYTEDPTIIFDTCAQFGRLKSIKVDEKHDKGGV